MVPESALAVDKKDTTEDFAGNDPHYIDPDEITSPATPAAMDPLHVIEIESARLLEKKRDHNRLFPQSLIDKATLSKWDDRFMKLAIHVAEWSKDPSTKVGAVIVDGERRVVGMGYNGFPRGVNDDPSRYSVKAVKYRLVVHSEANAILNANGIVTDCTLYTTKFPCTECAKLIIQSSIARVFTPLPSQNEPWAEDANYSMQMFNEAGVGIHFCIV